MIHRFFCVLNVLLLAGIFVQPATAQTADTRKAAETLKAAKPGSVDNAEMASRVRQEFLHAWNAYKQYAWGHDELRPLSKSARDWYGVSLYMTPLDSLDTMILMGLREEAESTREYIVKNLSFDHDIYVKNFEITIRMLGGLLSNYQLTGDKRLLALAEDLGNRLLPAFNSKTGMPYVFVNLKTGAVRGEVSNPAEIGTLLVEAAPRMTCPVCKEKTLCASPTDAGEDVPGESGPSAARQATDRRSNAARTVASNALVFIVMPPTKPNR